MNDTPSNVAPTDSNIFKLFVEKAVDGLLVIDRDGIVRFANPAAISMFADKTSELVGTFVGVPAIRNKNEIILPRADGFLYVELLAADIQWEGRPASLASLRDFTERIQTASQLKSALTETERLLAAADQMRLVQLGVLEDVTEAEAALRAANRALKALSAGNAALVRATSEEELLQTFVRVVVEQGGYRLATVGFAADDAEKSITPVAWSGTEEGYYSQPRPTWADTEEGQVPIARAIRSGTLQVCRDIASDPGFGPWKESAIARGYASNIALPLSDGTRTFGGLSIYSSELGAFDEEENRLLSEMAEDLAYGIVTLRTRGERDRIAHAHEHHAEILQRSLEQSIRAIADTVEARDPYTAGHQRRVGELAVALARELGLPEEKIHGIQLAATIHDLGKIQIPAEILSKPSKLSDIEFLLIKTHPQAGYDILKNIEFPWPIADIVRQHHEKLDGSGYPQGLKGAQILLESRIMTAADVVEAMSSHRPYRAALGIEVALKEIARGRGSAYDPAVTDACIKLFREQGFSFATV